MPPGARRRGLRDTGEYREYFKRTYGPTIAAYRFVADDPEKVAALDRDLADLGTRLGLADGARTMRWEDFLFTGRRA